MRRARREKAKRDNLLDDKRRKLKEDLESREKVAKEKSEEKTKDLKKNKEEERFQTEIERLRREGNKLLEQEMDFIDQQVRMERKRTKEQKESKPIVSHQPARFKISWPSKLNDKIDEDLIRALFEKYGEIDVLVIGKKLSAVLEYKHLDDAFKCLNDESNIKDTYSISLKWLGPDLKSKPAEEVIVEEQNEFQSFEDMEAAILKKLKEASA